MYWRIIFAALLVWGGGAAFSQARAQVSLDGTVGPSGPLSGPDYVIGSELGRQLGPNLFHSFGDFNVNTGESATFTGPGSVSNVISRVTGGATSNINGLLRSTIPSADLYLINPSGLVFGPNASLDVQGSFHSGTADFLRLDAGAPSGSSTASALGRVASGYRSRA